MGDKMTTRWVYSGLLRSTCKDDEGIWHYLFWNASCLAKTIKPCLSLIVKCRHISSSLRACEAIQKRHRHFRFNLTVFASARSNPEKDYKFY